MAAEHAPGRLRGSPGWLLGQASLGARRALGEVFDAAGLHRSQHALLACLEEFGPLDQTSLSERTGLDRSDVVRWIDDLGRRRFVAREQDLEDRRRNLISITGRGSSLLGSLDAGLAEAEARFLQALSEAERRQLTRLLQRVVDS